MIYMGNLYHSGWLERLADDVTGEGAAWDGVIHGPENVHAVVAAARTLYEYQNFSFVGPYGDNGVIEEFTTEIRGVDLSAVILVSGNADGKTERIVVNHWPRSAMLFFSRLMYEKFVGTPLAEHFLADEP